MRPRSPAASVSFEHYESTSQFFAPLRMTALETNPPHRPRIRAHPLLYEIHTWAWLEEISDRKGEIVTLGSVPDQEWNKLRDQGFDLVWLMGVWKRGSKSREVFQCDIPSFPAYDAALPGWRLQDVVGSPYSIADYVPDPRIGSWPELDMARDKLHARKMGLILDFVPNHTAPDHPWVQAHPEYYVQGSLADFRSSPSSFFPVSYSGSTLLVAHGRDPYFPPWPDTAQLNYFNPATRNAMLGVLSEIAKHCDGVRCDMAMLCLNEIFEKTWASLAGRFSAPSREFWTDAFEALPRFLWIAEVYWDLEWQLQQLGFDFTYDKRLYDRLLHAPAPEVRTHLASDAAYQGKLARFLENHDEPRSASAFTAERIRAAATLVATLPGMRFYYQGQFEGRKNHLPIQLRRAADESADAALEVVYSKLLALSRQSIFHEGEWKLLEARPAGDSSFESLIAYQWRKSSDLSVVVVNLAPSRSQGNVIVENAFDGAARYRFIDQLHGQSYDWSGADLNRAGLYVRLEPFQSHVFDVERAGEP
jgi:hypothetical protein